MATLEELRGAGKIGRHNPRLSRGRLAVRRFYYTERFKDWCVGELRTIKSTMWGEDLPVVEQLNDLIKLFVSGDDLDVPRNMHVMVPVKDAIWELKTGDLRIFGWFAAKDAFVACTGADATFLKEWEPFSYHCKRTWSVSERNQLDLSQPKFLRGRKRHDVITIRN